MSATETPLVTPDALNKMLTAENADLRMREQVGKEAFDKMAAENSRLHAQIENLLKPMRDQAIARADSLAADLAARDALIGEMREAVQPFLGVVFVMPEDRKFAEAANLIRTILARTPADAGAELERLRGEIKRYSEVVVRDLLERNGELCAERDALRAQLAEKEAELASALRREQDQITIRKVNIEQREAAEARLAAVLGAADPDSVKLAAVIMAGDELYPLALAWAAYYEDAYNGGTIHPSHKKALEEWPAAKSGAGVDDAARKEGSK